MVWDEGGRRNGLRRRACEFILINIIPRPLRGVSGRKVGRKREREGDARGSERERGGMVCGVEPVKSSLEILFLCIFGEWEERKLEEAGREGEGRGEGERGREAAWSAESSP